jgi:glutamate dehydrogenase (NADP+)
MHPEAKQVLEQFMIGLIDRNPHETEFHQAVREVAESVIPFTLEHTEYRDARILERMTEPDRIITFRVTWEDDQNRVRVNRAWRVQFNNSIGPYKGGLRFDKSLTLSVLKFLGFEQVFKNSLTTLPMGGGKGGSNFNPKGKSDREVMRFCQALMTELHRHIGPETDVPAGDIGVGSREISFMFGQYKRLVNRFSGTLTGKGLTYGGSLMRTEATGYGCAYFMQNMLNHSGDGVEGKTALVSGSGNVAIYAIEKLNQLGATCITASDRGGFVYDPNGIRDEKLAFLKDLKEVRRGSLVEYAEKFRCDYHEGQRPWVVPAQLAMPCATQNELVGENAEELVKNGVLAVAEGANMPTDLAGVKVFRKARTLFAPGKAANAGGVAVSGLEQSQNAQRLSWTREEVDTRLQSIMHKVHSQCLKHGAGEDDTYIDYVRGANLAGFQKVADAMLAYGIV